MWKTALKTPNLLCKRPKRWPDVRTRAVRRSDHGSATENWYNRTACRVSAPFSLIYLLERVRSVMSVSHRSRATHGPATGSGRPVFGRRTRLCRWIWGFDIPFA